MTESQLPGKHKWKPVLIGLLFVLLIAFLFVALPKRTPARPGLEAFLSHFPLVHEEIHAPIGVTSATGVALPMTRGAIRVYTVQRPVGDVVSEATKVFQKSDGWFHGKSVSYWGNEDFFTFNDKTKTNPLPWEISAGAFSYVTVTLRPGRSKEIETGIPTTLFEEKEPWTTIIVEDDGHPKPKIDQFLPFLHPEPPISRTKSYTTMPSPAKPGGPAIGLK